jgi:hypothetical protein
LGLSEVRAIQDVALTAFITSSNSSAGTRSSLTRISAACRQA